MFRRLASRSPAAVAGRPAGPTSSGAARSIGQTHASGTKDRSRFKDGADPGTGQQVTWTEVPDMLEFQKFNTNTLEHVKVPEVPLAKRMSTDVDREAEMVRKYGADGPGERLQKTLQQERRDALEKQQDIDGLPWEVRWKRNLIPTHEEIIQDVRDRFELYEVDPIERERLWYMHWQDRLFKAQRDRLVWPQGYTDYLDHYDETGRRRTLPTDQRWSDVSWKHLADANYRDRMWMIEGEERRMNNHMMDDERLLLEEHKTKLDEIAEISSGLNYGVIDVDPNQAAQALSGTADPLEVARTKFKIDEYAAEQAWTLGKNAKEFDPVTGLPKSERPPLATGVTVEQAAALDTRIGLLDEKMQQDAEGALIEGESGALQYARSQLTAARKLGEDRPPLRTVAERSVKQLREANLAIEEIKAKRAGLEAGASAETKAMAGFAQLEAQSNADVASISGTGGESATPSDAVSANLKLANAAALEGGPAAPAASQGPRRIIVRDDGDSAIPRKSGFIEVTRRPDGTEPAVHQDIMHKPRLPELDEVPSWYTEQAVETGPMIGVYGLTGDPLEAKPVHTEFTHTRPSTTEDSKVVYDEIKMGDNAFDEGRLYRERVMPEATRGVYQGLPTYREVVETPAAAASAAPGDGALDAPKKSKSELLKEKRRTDAKSRSKFDPDLALPDLPWETDPSRDPKRGVSDVATVAFDRKAVEATFRAYKEFLQQKLVELANMKGSAADDRVEAFIRDAIEAVRKGYVGDHPVVGEEIEGIFKLVFEGHLKQFLADYYSFRGGRKSDADALKAEGDDLLRRAGAQSKQLGTAFMDLMQEFMTVELESVRKNPVQRHCILCRERSHEVIAKPFVRWITSELTDFTRTEYQSYEQVDTAKNYAMKHLNEAKYKSPRRVEGVSDGTRDYIVESFYHWGRGALLYHSGRKLFEMYLKYADSRFRSGAEEFFEESYEVFIAYYRTSRECGVFCPVPYSEPIFDFQDQEYLEGESGYYAEIAGDMERAERIWHTGTAVRWYPQYDETDFMHFNERRGRYGQAFECSDRCLESLQKKSHPSVAPFPDRAKQWLEGAPLTQETAEHLWMRYMGDVYLEHADFCGRTGKQQTAREHMSHGLNFYRLALRSATERLPPTWIAPILTKTKLLARCITNATVPQDYIAEVEENINAIRKLPGQGPKHWMDRLHDVHWRVSLLYYSLPMYGKRIAALASGRAKHDLSDQYMMGEMEKRAKTGFIGGFTPIEIAGSEIAGEIYRCKVIKWRDMENKLSCEWHVLNLLYFTFRVTPRTAEEVDQLKDQLWPTYDWFYMQAALGIRSRTRMFSDAVRRISQVLMPGTEVHKKLLLTELQKIQEKLHHAVDSLELNRAVTSLEVHLADPSKPPYIFGSNTLLRQAQMQNDKVMNPMLLADSSRQSYEILKERERSARTGAAPSNSAAATNSDIARNPTNLDGDNVMTRERGSMKKEHFD